MCSSDLDLQASWRRFHLIGALLRNEAAPPAAARDDSSPAATLRLMAALALEAPLSSGAALTTAGTVGEPPVAAHAPLRVERPSGQEQAVTQPRLNTRRWYAAGLGLATAAGLTAGMWLGVPGGPMADGVRLFAANTSGLAAVGPNADSSRGLNRIGAPLQAAFNSSQSEAQRRARLYMLIHAQQAGLSQASQGVSLVKFVSYRQSAHAASSNGAQINSALHGTDLPGTDLHNTEQ